MPRPPLPPLLLLLALGACTADPDAADTGADTADTGDTGPDTGDTGDTAADTGSDTADMNDTGASDTGDIGDTGLVSTDPFEAASCGGTAWTQEEAAAYLGSSNAKVLGQATIVYRTRTCPTSDTCESWGTTQTPWTIHYLEYSGGSVTRWVDVQADMQLVLFDDHGTAKLSLEHVTFGVSGGQLVHTDGMVYAFPPAPISYPHVRAWNVTATGSDYEELDQQVVAGTLDLGDGCARWTAWPYGTGQPYRTQYAARFTW